MLTAAGVRIVTELLGEDLRAGRIRIEGGRVYRGQQEVEPRLSFVRSDDPPATWAPSLGPPPGDKGLQESGERTEEVAVTYPRFAALPENRLLPTDRAAQDRARMAAQRHSPAQLMPQRRETGQTFRWPANLAPLPPPALTRKDR